MCAFSRHSPSSDLFVLIPELKHLYKLPHTRYYSLCRTRDKYFIVNRINMPSRTRKGEPTVIPRKQTRKFKKFCRNQDNAMLKRLKPIRQGVLKNNEYKFPVTANLVGTLFIDSQKDPTSLMKNYINIEYKRPRFAAVILRVFKPNATALTFKAGKIVCVGAKSIENLRCSAQNYRLLIGGRTSFKHLKIHNKVCTGSVDHPLDIQAMYQHYKNLCEYDPEQFPGLIRLLPLYEDDDRVAVVLLFDTGNYIIMGLRQDNIFKNNDKDNYSLKDDDDTEDDEFFNQLKNDEFADQLRGDQILAFKKLLPDLRRFKKVYLGTTSKERSISRIQESKNAHKAEMDQLSSTDISPPSNNNNKKNTRKAKNIPVGSATKNSFVKDSKNELLRRWRASKREQTSASPLEDDPIDECVDDIINNL